ncbi:acetyl/propionyl/methylcrotonyl-CoA carboxylase subunit alpha [Maricaulis maris]|jgi:propionyl-CoA carboxylase alpha chain|uniref:acetyl/propionyl/methylcrotonyl-CoA carboxylase subunit alpha n=1 Tax=Maricaulis maris TaxID=74318 RepID=UPI0026F033E7|nr:acetyl/propionyl/methylcrotonyl-CoA carboxylase subunit alpha [Maricaulis maris]
MFKKILIANRGEIAVRVIKTCKRLGIATVAVYSEADADSLAVEMADEAVFIGASAPGESYLVLDKILDAVKQTGADAVHPGFGFLSENPALPKALEKAGIGWIGPNIHAIDAMGDKIRSKQLAAKAGVSTIPGADGEIADAETALAAAKAIGYPVMLKASAGGGGKGMRIARSDSEVKEGFKAARNEAKSSFGDDRILIEKFIEEPRHIEIQVMGDKHGHVIHLNERECSIQRRNQKVLEEAPSPFLDKKTREAMGAQAVSLAAAVDYDSAGTVEFIVDKDKKFYFLEMNTRLQVEHPVTELTTDVDLVELMIRSAFGEELGLAQRDVPIKGWAVEARLYAEDPYRGFLPSIGRLKRFQEPAEGKLGEGTLRIDAGVREGDEISLFYDPMIAKVIGYGKTREIAIDTLSAALDRLHVEGLQSNAPFLSAVLDEADFRAGRIHTGYIGEHYPDGFHGTAPREEQLVAMTCAAAFVHETFVRRASQIEGRLRPADEPTVREWVVLLDKRRIPVEIEMTGNGQATIWAPSLASERLQVETAWRAGQHLFEARINGETIALEFADRTEGYQMRHRGFSAVALVCTARAAELHALLPEKEKPDMAKLVVSPMPGLVVSLEVEEGQAVKTGEPLVIVEAMKMENVLRAETDGTIKAVKVEAGASVAADELLVEFE